MERFEGTSRTYSPKASIWKRGQIGLNNDVLKKFKIKKDKKNWYVICFYSRERHLIGFQFTQDSSKKGIIKISFRPGGATLSVKSFLDYYSIDRSENRRYDITYEKKLKMYVIDLKS